MAKPYTLLLTTSGVGVKSVISKVVNSLTTSFTFRDIEAVMLGQPETMDCLRRHIPTFQGRPTMYDLTWNLTRTEVKGLWAGAIAKCLTDFEQASTNLNILLGHPVYYGGERRQFYSVLDSSKLTRLDANRRPVLYVERVGFLLDDIYDTYLRLAEKDQLLDWSSSPEEFLSQAVEEGRVRKAELGEEPGSTLLMKWERNALSSLLLWRYLSIVLAENLALQMGAKFMLWATKQYVTVFDGWLLGKRTSYISHPISEARRQLVLDGKWGSIVEEVNKLPLAFLSNGLVCLQPSAIDELRFDREERGQRRYLGRLSPRWPLPTSAEIMYTPPSLDSSPDHASVLLPKVWNPVAGVKPLTGKHSPLLRDKLDSLVDELKEPIDFQVASRDHLLVSHSEGLIVYRPYWGGRSSFSRGVKAEVRHWAPIASETCRAAFIHFHEDVHNLRKKIVEQDKGKALSDALKGKQINAITERFGVTPDQAEQIVSSMIRGTPLRSTLAEGPRPVEIGKVKKNWQDLLTQSKLGILRQYLTGPVSVISEHTGVFVFKGREELVRKVGDVSSFVVSGVPKTNGWEEDIETLFPIKLR